VESALKCRVRFCNLAIAFIAVCRNPETAIELNKFVQESNGRGQIFKSDACDEIALANIANAIVGGIDVLVCNAGVMSARGGLSDAENNAASVSAVLMTNTAGPFFAARAFHKNLKLSSAPRICIISSYMGSQQHQGASAYFIVHRRQVPTTSW